jgi:hypothetical protein
VGPIRGKRAETRRTTTSGISRFLVVFYCDLRHRYIVQFVLGIEGFGIHDSGFASHCVLVAGAGGLGQETRLSSISSPQEPGGRNISCSGGSTLATKCGYYIIIPEIRMYLLLLRLAAILDTFLYLFFALFSIQFFLVSLD